MKWVLAGLCFACLVGLAVGTAAIKAENTQRRAEVLRLLDRRGDLQTRGEYEQMRLRELTDPRRLTELWLQMEGARLQ